MAQTAAGQQRPHRSQHAHAVAVLLFLFLMAPGCYSRVLEGATAAVDTGSSSSSSSSSSSTAEDISNGATSAVNAAMTADPGSASQPQILISCDISQCACAFNASCPVRSSLSCKWPSLKVNSKKTLVVSMVAVDAGNHASTFAVRSAGAFDMNPDNNGVKLPYMLTAGCCMADESGQPTCKDMSLEACVARNGLAFSPGLPCAKRPCEHPVVKANAAANGELGTCSFKYRCFELIRSGACQNRERASFSYDTCREVQTSSKPACQKDP